MDGIININTNLTNCGVDSSMIDNLAKRARLSGNFFSTFCKKNCNHIKKKKFEASTKDYMISNYLLN